MKETSKAMKRRWREHDEGGFLNWRDLFKGEGLDVGSGDDPLTCATPFDLSDGEGDDLTKFFPNAKKFDFIHGSQVLEHMLNAEVALRSWIRMLKPGGYIIATVPDFDLYEKCAWPSRWNAGHRSAWTMDRDVNRAVMGDSPCYLLPDWLVGFGCDIVVCRLVNTNYDYRIGPEVDQTYDEKKGVEAFIEFVLRT